MKKLIPIIILLPIITIGIYIFVTTSNDVSSEVEHAHTEEEFHIHAGFHVYVENELIDFSIPQYMKLGSCSVDHNEIKLDPIAEQLEKAHLHDLNGDVVHVHREGAKWSDLFYNIKFEIENPIGYINGELVENVLEQSINDNDRVLILVGKTENIEQKIESLPTIERIEEVANLSESCGT